MHVAREAPILQPNVNLLGRRWPDGCSQNAMPGSPSQTQQRTKGTKVSRLKNELGVRSTTYHNIVEAALERSCNDFSIGITGRAKGRSVGLSLPNEYLSMKQPPPVYQGP